MLTNLTCMHTFEKTNVGIPNACTLCTVLRNVLSNHFYTKQADNNFQLNDNIWQI